MNTEYTYTVHKNKSHGDDGDCVSISTSFSHFDLLAPDKVIAIAEEIGEWEEDGDYITAADGGNCIEIERGSYQSGDYQYAELTPFITLTQEEIDPSACFEKGTWSVDFTVFDLYEAWTCESAF